MVSSPNCYGLWLCHLGTTISDSDRIIKYVGFEPIIYVINFHIDSSSKDFNEFDSIFLSNVLLI